MLEVHGESNCYRPIRNSNGSWNMELLNIKDKYYGLSCENISELRVLLLANYATNVITKAFV